jgi:hypothetical protein
MSDLDDFSDDLDVAISDVGTDVLDAARERFRGVGTTEILAAAAGDSRAQVIRVWLDEGWRMVERIAEVNGETLRETWERLA